MRPHRPPPPRLARWGRLARLARLARCARLARWAARARGLAAAAAGAALAGCIVVPAQVETWDASCGTVSRHLELQAVQVAAINRCAGTGCEALVLAAAATAAASAIVSGSVVVIGNVAYWLERQAACGRPAPPLPPAPAADAPSA
jgi:hypothetical protein